MKIAVVGGGISGLSAALILSPHHEVHLFESESRLGGHAHTVSVESGREKPVSLDTGFLVYNTLTYPHFTSFLDYLKVKTVASDMSLSIQTANGIEWSGTNLQTVFAQWQNGLNPSFLRMLADIMRFNRRAERNLELSRQNRWTLQDLVLSEKYSDLFQRLYLLPMTGAIWSMSYANALLFPAETFLTFCLNHRLLQINNRPIWRTIENGSINYVLRVHSLLKHVHVSCPVQRVRPHRGKLLLSIQGHEAEFDKVIFATHAPITREIIQSDFPELASELSPLKVSKNEVDLHEDSVVMPKKKICWSAWNVQARETIQDQQEISLTYYINKLQPLETDRQYFITLNNRQTHLRNLHRRFNYNHPQFDFTAIEVQKKLPRLQGQHGLFFTGAWTRYGFHEDGILSAVNVAKLLGADPPWK